MIYQLLSGLLMLSLLGGCSSTKKIQGVSNTAVIQKDTIYAFPYEINKPLQSFELPNILKEISGLGISSDDKHLYALQDENGIIFKLDKETGKIVDQKQFHDDGDYEGIEMVGEKIYVVKSSGNIYEVNNLWTEKFERKKFKFWLTKSNDIEGVTFDKKNNRLILAAKGFAPDKEENSNTRCFYSFNLESDSLEMTPVFSFQKEKMMEFVKTKVPADKRNLFASMNPGKGAFKLGPSGIAIHPITGNYYIVCSRGKVLAICQPDGNLIHVEKLDKKVHAQPEGITFDKAGNLYISNEGNDSRKALLYRFNMNQKK